MTKTELTNRVANKLCLEFAGVSKTAIKKIAVSVIDEIAEALRQGEEVRIPGFARFKIRKRKGDGNGGVDDESVAAYKAKRDANLAAMQQKEEVQKNDTDQDGAQAIEAFKQAMQGKLDHTRPIKAETFVKAIEVAYQQGRADALKEIDQDEITIDEVLKDILPSVKAKYAQAS